MQSVEVGLARPSADVARMRPLLAMKLGDIKAEFGIDVLRVVAAQTEPVYAHQHKGHIEAGGGWRRGRRKTPSLMTSLASWVRASD